MTPASPQQTKLQALLRELFQLDQPDLDFGLYRIMHAKAREIGQFLNDDLLKIISEAFAGNQADKVAQAKADYERKRQLVLDDGGNPDASKQVQQALAEYQATQESQGEDAELYDHLYRFFERYYDSGDFLARRYYARATSEKAEPYAVPYDGSEVYLHWANKDQYYIKTAENFRQFSVDMAQAKQGEAQLFEQTGPFKLHFAVTEAEEGAHNNVKGGESYFIVDAAQPLEWNNGELTVRFYYCADPEKTGQAGKWRETRNARNEAAILSSLQAQAQSGDEHAHRASQYAVALATEVAKGRDGKQTLLGKYLNQYTAPYSMDYFIHKNLGGFLKRELDFYIKNELFRLDDLGTVDAPNPQQYDNLLKKALTLRSVAHKLIEFLAQTEEFQKKLWLKKKFVVNTQWLVTLDKAPASIYPQIKANEAQWAEWVKLGFMEAQADRDALLTTDSKLVLDTRFYSADFTDELLAHISHTSGNLDEATGGVLVHSENFQALNLMQARHREQVKCIYIDPPYNTGSDGFAYKDSYKHSSWLTMIFDRIRIASTFQKTNSWLAVSIDEREHHRMLSLLENNFGEENIVSTITVKMSHLSGMKMAHVDKKPPKIKEYLSIISSSESNTLNPVYEKAEWDDVFERYGSVLIKNDSESDCKHWTKLPLRQFALNHGIKVSVPKEYDAFKLKYANQIFRTAVNDSLSFTLSPKDDCFHEVTTPTGLKKYALNKEEVLFASDKMKLFDGVLMPVKIKGDIWEDIGINNLHNEGGVTMPNGKKPVKLIERVCGMFISSDDLVLDYFAGSGTTGHAVINLNRSDGGKRKFILVEQGDYFDTVTKPRIAKVIYSADWKDGKPTSPETGISQLVKVIRLESYEDTINNLQVAEQSTRGKVIEANPALREAYFLHYLLDMETQGSPSLLNTAAFTDPTAYTLNIKKPGSEAQEARTVDLVETFNWLLGLRVSKLYAPQTYTASFVQEVDAELPGDAGARWVVKKITPSPQPSPPAPLMKPLANRLSPQGGKSLVIPQAGEGIYWFSAVEGEAPDAGGRLKRVLVMWRKLTGNLEQDNLVLEAYLREVLAFDVRQSQDAVPFDVVYVNGSHALPAMSLCEVRQLEEAFHRLMWDVQDA